MFFVLTLVTSGSTYAFVTGDLDPNFNSVFATSSSDGGKDGDGGSGSDSNKKSKSSSDEGGGGGGGQTTDEGSNNGGTSNTPTPPPSTQETTQTPPPTTEEATPPPPEANQQTCPDGSQADANGNCPSTPPVATGQTTPPPAATDQTCPDGSTPDPTTGSCPPAAAQQNPAPQTLTTQTCPDGSTPDPTSGNCPTSTTTTQFVPANSDGSCPTGSHEAGGSSGNAGQPGTGSVICRLDNPPPATSPNQDATPPLQPQANQIAPLAGEAKTLGPATTPVTCEKGKHADASGSCVIDFFPLPDGKCAPGTHPITRTGTTNCYPDDLHSDDPSGCVPGRHNDPATGKCVLDNPPTTQTGGTTTTTSTPATTGAGGAMIGTGTGTTTTPASTATTPGTTTGGTTGTTTSTPIKIYPSTPPITTTPITCEKDKHPLEGTCVSAGYPNDDLTCMKGTHASHTSSAYLGVMCISDVKPAGVGTCPAGMHLVGSDYCLPDNSAPIQYCTGGTPILFNGKCYDHLPVIGGSTTGSGGGFIQMFPTVPANKDGSCPEGSRLGSSGNDGTRLVCHPGTGTTPTPTPAVVDLKPDGSCPEGYYKTGSTKYPCLKNATTTTTTTTTQTGSTGAGGTTTTGGGTTTATPEPPSELEVPPVPGTGTCPPGTHGGGTYSTKPGEGSVTCLAQKTPDGSFILPTLPQSQGSNCNSGYVSVGGTTCVLDISCPQGTTKIGATQCIVNKVLPAATTTALPAQKPSTTTGPGGPTTTTTTTGNPTTPTPATSPTTTTKPPTSTTAATTTTTNVINKGGSSTAGGGNAAAPAQGANTFLTYVNAVNKLTIKYPSTWTKTDLVGNPSIPVMFSAPTAIIAAAGNTPATKTSFVISITPSASNLDSFTRQQINTLTNSKAVIYTITDTNAKVLTPPTGITAFREVSYDAMKNGVSGGNNIPTQVPLKGAAIFFVNGGTGYSLLYLAKQTEYTQNLPMVQQMVNSFQIGAPGGGAGVQNVAAASGAR